MRVCVTGSDGFIGSNLCSFLKKRGHDVIVFDNGSNVYPYLKHSLPRISPSSCFSFDMIRSPEVIIHLAAMNSIPRCDSLPLGCYYSNIAFFNKVIETAQLNGVRRIIYASSSSVYGDQPIGPIKETAVLRPKSLYAKTKLANEHMAACAQHTGIETVGLRFFNIYGPYQYWGWDHSAFIPKAIYKVATDQPVTLYNQGDNYRDFTYVEDICAGIEAAMLVKNPSPIYNLGAGRPVSTDLVLETIGSLMGTKPNIEYLGKRQNEASSSHADISLAIKELGFNPKTHLADGLSKTIGAYYRDQQKTAVKLLRSIVNADKSLCKS